MQYPAGALRFIGLALVVGALVVLLDLLSKQWIERELGPGGSRPSVSIAGQFLELRYTLNSGVAFGLLNGSSTLAGIAVGIVIVPLIVVLIVLASRGQRWALGAGLVLGGAAANLLDRIGDSSVTDFISVGRWPSFNLADAAITAGALVLIGLSLREHRSTPANDGQGPS